MNGSLSGGTNVNTNKRKRSLFQTTAFKNGSCIGIDRIEQHID